MKQITKRDLTIKEGTIIYREKSDCSYWKIIKTAEENGNYKCAKCDDETLEELEEVTTLTPSDIIGDYIV